MSWRLFQGVGESPGPGIARQRMENGKWKIGDDATLACQGQKMENGKWKIEKRRSVKNELIRRSKCPAWGGTVAEPVTDEGYGI